MSQDLSSIGSGSSHSLSIPSSVSSTAQTHGATWSSTWSTKKAVDCNDAQLQLVAGLLKDMAEKPEGLEANQHKVIYISSKKNTCTAKDITELKTLGCFTPGRVGKMEQSESAVIKYLENNKQTLKDSNQWENYLKVVNSFGRQEGGPLEKYIIKEQTELLKNEYCPPKGETYQKDIGELDPTDNKSLLKTLEKDLEAAKGDESLATNQKLRNHLDFIAEARQRGVITGDDREFNKLFAAALPTAMNQLSTHYPDVESHYTKELRSELLTQHIKPDNFSNYMAPSLKEDGELLTKVFDGCKKHLGSSQRKELEELNQFCTDMRKIDGFMTRTELKGHIKELIGQLQTAEPDKAREIKESIAAYIPLAYKDLYTKLDDMHVDYVYSDEMFQKMQENQTMPDTLIGDYANILPDAQGLAEAAKVFDGEQIPPEITKVAAMTAKMQVLFDNKFEVHKTGFHEFKHALDSITPAGNQVPVLNEDHRTYSFQEVGMFSKLPENTLPYDQFVEFINNKLLSAEEKDKYIELIGKTKLPKMDENYKKLIDTHHKQKELIHKYEEANAAINAILSPAGKIEPEKGKNVAELTTKITHLGENQVAVEGVDSYELAKIGFFTSNKKKMLEEAGTLIAKWINSYEGEGKQTIITENLFKGANLDTPIVKSLLSAYEKQKKLELEFTKQLNNGYDLTLPKNRLF